MGLTATLALDVRAFESGLKKAAVELQTFERGTKSMNRDLKRLLEDFSGQKVVAEAARMAEAVARIGGASKLTDVELRRVAATTAHAVEKMRLMGEAPPAAMEALAREARSLVDGMDALKTTAGGAEVSFGKLVGTWVTAQFTLATLEKAGRLAFDFVSDSIGEANAAEAAQKKLTTALQAQGLALPGLQQQYADMASAFQRTTVNSDDLVTEMQSLLVQVGDVMPSSMDAALEAAQNLAAGLDIDLRTATLAVGKAIAGESGSLKRYGIDINDVAVQARGASAVFEAVNASFGGQAAAQIDTMTGRLKQAENAWNDFKEAMGTALLDSEIVKFALDELTAGIGGVQAGTEQAEPSIDRAFGVMLRDPIQGIPAMLEALASYSNELERMKRVADTIKSPFDQFRGNADALARQEHGPSVEEILRLDKETAALKKQFAESEQAAKQFTEALARIGGSGAAKSAEEIVRQLHALGGPANVLPSQLAALAKTLRDGAEAALLMGDVKLAQEYELLAQTLNPLIQLQQRYNVTLRDGTRVGGSYTQEVLEQIDALEQQVDFYEFGIIPALTRASFAWVGYKAATTSAIPGITQTGVELDKLHAAAARKEGLQGLRDLSSAFAELAQISGKDGGLFQAIADTVGAMALAGEAGEQLRRGYTTLTTDGGGMDAVIAGFTQLTAGALASVAAMQKSITTTSDAQGAWQGFASGAQTGAQAGGFMGAIIGGLIGMAVGTDRARQNWREMRREAQASFNAIQDDLEDLVGETGNLSAAAQVLGLDWQAVFGLNIETSNANILAFAEEFRERLDEINGEFGPLLGNVESFGRALPAALRTSIQQLIDLGVLTDDVAGGFGNFARGTELDYKKMQEAAERYGIDINSLGDGFQAAKQRDTAQGIVDDFEMLTGNGASVGGVLQGMREEISALVNDSIRFKTELPENMRPWIEELARSGQLLDDNGEKITDTSKLKFGAPLKSEFDKVVSALEKLIQALQGPLQRALADIPTNIDIDITGHYTPPNLPDDTGGNDDTGDGSNGLSRRVGSLGATGRFFEQWGEKGTPVRLHGEEAVVRRDQASAFAATFGDGGGGGGAVIEIRVPVYLDGRQVAESVVRHIPGELKRQGAI